MRTARTSCRGRPERVRVLITGGASGQLRGELLRGVPPGVTLCEPDGANGAERLDVTDAAAVHERVARLAPDVIVNAAAYTAVDRAECEPAAAEAVNVDGVRHLAEAAAVGDAQLVHVSTDFVFGGAAAPDGGVVFAEDAPTAPLSVYGRTKRDGERVLAATLGERGCTVRTAWVYSSGGANFVRTMLRLFGERDEIGVVADQIGSPTWARGLAAALWRVAILPRERFAACGGTLHWTGAGVASWYDLAVATLEEGRALGLVSGRPRIVPLTTAEYPTPARRPAASVLATARTRALLGLPPVHWREELRAMLGEIA